MSIPIVTALKFAFKNAYLKITSVILILTFIGLSIVGHYGISSDELTEIRMAQWNFELLTKGQPIPWGIMKYYGPLFNVTSEGIFQAKEFLTQNFFHDSLSKNELKNDRLNYTQFYQRIKVKHVVTFLVSLITYIAVAGIVGILVGLKYAWFGPVTLALFPRFFGHSFFNPKDIPFAAMFTLGTFLGACLVNCYLKTAQEDIKFGLNRITLYSLVYGLLVGLVTGTRLVGFLLLLFVGIAHIVSSLGNQHIVRSIFRFWNLYGLMFIAWMITTIIVHPASWYNPGGHLPWGNPVKWFFDALKYLSQSDRARSELFDGQFISTQSLPWFYLPKWLAITIPELFLVMFLVGLLGIFLQYKKFTYLQRACVILVLLQIFFFPAIAILKQSSIYDGMRHFLFILPGIAAISATGLIWIFSKISRQTVRLFALALIITSLISIVLDMVALHPYEYVYFNRISGGLAKAHNRYETDYWGLSMREGMEWINTQAGDNAKVVSSPELHASKIFAAPGINVAAYRSYEKAEQKEEWRPFFYVAKPKWDYQSKFPGCPVVYSVKRQDVPLTIVKKCN